MSQVLGTSFVWENDITVLFKELHVTSSWGLLAVAATFVVWGGFYEVLRCFRLRLAQANLKKRQQNVRDCMNTGRGPFTLYHIIQTFLYLVETISSFAIMLMVMTFNVWLLISVVVGSTLGYQISHMLSPSHDPILHSSGPAVSVPTCKDDQCCKTDVWLPKNGKENDHLSECSEEIERSPTDDKDESINMQLIASI